MTSHKKLVDFTSFADAQANYSKPAIWALFDGDKEHFNISHECISRHVNDTDRVAVRVVNTSGQTENITFSTLEKKSSQIANWLVDKGIKPGDRVAFMLEPSEAYYAGLFGALKMGAIGVPLFTLFGPEALKLRVEDCAPKLLLTNEEKQEVANSIEGLDVVVANANWDEEIAPFSTDYEAKTSANDLAIFQYTSGTTRELPEAVKHTHGAVVVLMGAALYGTGIRPGDEFFCPSSPAWGHGLWHGTLAPLALGVTTGTMAGKFDAKVLIDALVENKISNLSAAATHYRMMKVAGTSAGRNFSLEKLSYTGEPIDPSTLEFIDDVFKIPVCSMYGTTEIGVVLVNYPGAEDFLVKPGSLGKPVPGVEMQVQDSNGNPTEPNQVGELFLKRRGNWLSTKDLAHIDEDGYFFHGGRADDVIISAGWTMSAVEIENVLMKHDDVEAAAAIGVKDEIRGMVVKAFVVSKREQSDEFTKELQQFTRNHLAQYEYPRIVSVVSELPRTPAGKVNRRILRQQEEAATKPS